MHVFKSLLIVAGLAALLPAPKDDTVIELQTPAMITAAARAVSDLGEFCANRPGVCDTAAYVAGRIEAKAKYSAILLLEWAGEASRESRNGLPSGLASANHASQSTLVIADLLPDWRPPTIPAKG
jgi:hypothetical protein